ncbi:hypothetical protein Tco_0034614, partial [Tanacetum coccineum]
MDLNGKWLCFLLEYTSLSRKLEERLILIRRNLQGLTRRKSDVTSEVGKKEEVIASKKFGMIDGYDNDGQSDGVIASKKFGMIDGYDNEDEIEEGAAKIYNLITRVDTKKVSTTGDVGEFALMGVTFK